MKNENYILSSIYIDFAAHMFDVTAMMSLRI